MNRMLLVTTSFPNHIEGAAAAGVFVRDFALALVNAGIAVAVVTPAEESSLTLEQGIHVTRFTVPKLPLSLLNPMHLWDCVAIVTTLIRGSQAVEGLCERFRPDHILALWTLPSGDWAMRSSRRFDIPYSIWALGSDIWTLGRMPVLRQYTARVLRGAAYRFADGYELATEVESIGHRPCTFLPSCRAFGSKNARLPSHSPPYRFAFLGRWHVNKGVDLLLEALGLLVEEDWKRIEAVRIHGGGPLANQVQESVATLMRAHRPVEVGGYLDQYGAMELFEWTDYVLIPSRIESIPVVFSDAMQAFRPVITSPVGDMPRLMDSLQCGVLAKRPDAPAIAAAVREATSKSPLGFRQQLSQAASIFDIHGVVASFIGSIGLR